MFSIYRYSAKMSAREMDICKQRHLASIPLLDYNFLMDGPIWTVFGMYKNIDYQNKIIIIIKCSNIM